MAHSDRETLTRQIRDAVDIVDLVGSYVALRRAGASFKGLCPFHQEKTPSFTVRPATQTFYCFGCNAGGDVFAFVQLKENVSFIEARRLLAERAGISLEHEEVRSSKGGPGKSDLARVNAWAQQVFRRYFTGSAGEAARQYALGRGLTQETIDAWGLGFAVDSFDSLIRQAQSSKVSNDLLLAAGLIKAGGRNGFYDTFRNRLMFPIMDVTGRVIGFGGRALGDDPAKYMNTPATTLFDKSTNLFGLDRARQAIPEQGLAVVVEGYLDCIMAHQFGFTCTVATLGTAMTDEHARLLKRYTDRVVLVFDSDEAGQRAAERALSVSVMSGLEVTLARVPQGKDPCDYLLSAGAEAFTTVLNEGIGALEFRWQQVAQQFEASQTDVGRRRAIDAYLQQIADWAGQGAIDQIQMGLVLNKLSRILSLPVEELRGQLRGMIRKPVHTAPAAVSGPGPDRGVIGAEQSALRQIVEVLLNAPEYYDAVEEDFDPAMIRDPALAEVACRLLSMIRSDEPLRVDELIGRFESPSFGRLITELQERGQRRGRYDLVIQGAIDCLRQARLDREAARLGEQVRSRSPGAAEHEEEILARLAQRGRESQFLPVRARRKYLQH